MNWNVFLKLLLPIRLRLAALLIALLSALTACSRRRFDLDLIWVEALILDLKYTSQVLAMVKLLNDKFDPTSRSIVIEDGTEGNVTLWGNENLDYVRLVNENNNILIVRNEEDCSVGVDFVVRVPLYVNKDNVRLFLKRYVFAGVGFKVINL